MADPQSQPSRDGIVQLARGFAERGAADPMAQSAAALLTNAGALWLAVLAQFWVVLSCGLAATQFWNTYLVLKRRRSVLHALALGIAIVVVNYLALALAVLGQFWVFFSTLLATTQFISLLRIIWSNAMDPSDPPPSGNT